MEKVQGDPKPKGNNPKANNPPAKGQSGSEEKQTPAPKQDKAQKDSKSMESKPQGDNPSGTAQSPTMNKASTPLKQGKVQAGSKPKENKLQGTNPPAAVQSTGKQITFHTKDIEKDESKPKEENLRALIRPTLLGKQVTAQGLSIDSYEFIKQRYTYEGGQLSLDGSIITDLPEEEPVSKLGSVNSTRSRRVTEHEWHILRFSSIGGGLDLEMWWRRSPTSVRLTAVLTAIILAIAILHLMAGLAFIIEGLKQDPDDPYVCTTSICIKSELWMNESMNLSINPCDNFYEFMCKNYKEEAEEGNLFDNMVTAPAFKIEVDKVSILTMILSKYSNDTKYDQHIDFFRSCLDFPKRDQYQKEELANIMYDWFGTKDLSTFKQNENKSMEQVAADVMKTIGHASFMSIAFYTYPFIQITEPHPNAMNYRFGFDKDNKKFLEKLYSGLVDKLGLASADSVEEMVADMVNGADVMSTIIYELHTSAKTLTGTPEDAGNTIVNGPNLKGLCPPMGIKFDYSNALELFIRENYTVVYQSPTAQKYALALKACFNQPKEKFTKFTFNNNEIAFAALWIGDAFLREFIIGMDYKSIIDDWGFEEINNNSFVMELMTMKQTRDEYICMDTLFTALGYLPSVRFLMTLKQGPVNFMQESEAYIGARYNDTQYAFSQIPIKELDWRLKMLGDAILDRKLHVNVGFPLVGGLLDTEAALNFSGGFLQNIVAGLKHTVESGRQNWMGSTDPHPNIKWFARGGPGSFKNTLFIPHFVHIDSARFEEKKLAAKNREWEKFLGRKLNNYVLFPMAAFDGEQADFTSLKHARFTVPMFQTILSLLHDSQEDSKYPSLVGDEDALLGSAEVGLNGQSDNRNCSMLYVGKHPTDPGHEDYNMVPSNVLGYSWERDSDKLFLALLSIKLAYKNFLIEEEMLGRTTFNYDMPVGVKNNVMQKRLPRSLSHYEPKKLFFMGYVRNICRASWKVNSYKGTPNIYQHYLLETTVLHVLMQMEEFAEVWGCGNETMMNNRGKPRCFQFSP